MSFIKYSLLAFGLLSVSLPCTFAFAASEMTGKDPEAQFASMDTDKDGKVTSQEFFAAYPQMRETAFESIDSNKDGAITFEEWQGFTQGHSSAKPPAGMGGGMGGGMPPAGMGGGMGGGMPPAGMKGDMPPAGMGGGMPPAGMKGGMPPMESLPGGGASSEGAKSSEKKSAMPDLIMPSDMKK